MNKQIVFPLLIIATSIVVFFTGLGSTNLWDEDEGFFASTAYEMYQRGDWIVPYFNGEMFGHKPPFMYWMMIIGFTIFEDRELGARFFSAVFGTATAILTYGIGRRLFNPLAGFVAGMVMSTSLMFTVVARSATADSYLVFFSTLALYLYINAIDIRRTETDSATATQRGLLPPKWSSYFVIYAVMGFGVLVKGPIGFLFPMAVIGLFLLCTTRRRTVDANTGRLARWRENVRPFGPINFLLTVWRMRPLTAVAAILLVSGPWYFAVDQITDGRFLGEFFGKHHFGRFSEAMDDHNGGPLYYVIALLVGMFPASVFAAPVAIDVVRTIRSENSARTPMAFLCCWAGVYIIIFSLAATKLPNYILPAFPAVALMIGYYVDRLIREKETIGLFWPSMVTSVLAFIGVLFCTLLPLICLVEFSGRTILDRFDLTQTVQQESVVLCLIGVPTILGGLIALGLVRRRSMELAGSCLAITAVTIVCFFWNVGVKTVDRHQTPQQMARIAKELNEREEYLVAQYRIHRPSMPFYVGGRVEPIEHAHNLSLFLNERRRTLLVTTERFYPEVEDHTDVPLQVLRVLPGFPKTERILLVAVEQEQLAAKNRRLSSGDHIEFVAREISKGGTAKTEHR